MFNEKLIKKLILRLTDDDDDDNQSWKIVGKKQAGGNFNLLVSSDQHLLFKRYLIYGDIDIQIFTFEELEPATL